MHLETEDLSPVLKRVRATVPQARVDAGFTAAYAQIARTASVPGFRKGHVPRSVIVKRYRKQATMDVTRDLVNEGWRKAIDDLGLVPIAEPEFDAGSPREGEGYSFAFTVEIAPVFDIQPYDALSFERARWNASDDVVEHELGHLAERVASFTAVEGRDTVEKGDQILFDYAGSIDGVAFPGGTDTGAELEIGSGRFIPGFEDQTIGRKVGEAFAVEVTFPADYGAKELAGKAARFDCTIHEIRTRSIPDIGPALAEAVGEPDLDTLRSKMREQIEAHHTQQSDREAKEALKAALLAAYDFALPPTLVETDLHQRRVEFASKMMQEDKVTAEVALAAFKPTEDVARAKAEDAVRLRLILEAIAEKESIDVEPAEVNTYVEQMARSLGQFGGQVRQMYRDPNRRAGLRRQMREDRVLDMLLEAANTTRIDRDVPPHVHDHDHEAADGEAQVPAEGAAE
ncbi:MAG: trigger factor [bacterium]